MYNRAGFSVTPVPMSESEGQIPQPQPSQPAPQKFFHIPQKLGIAAAAALVIILGLVIFYPATTRSLATLNVICRHNLRSADLSLIVDGQTALTQQITGTVKKRFGVLDKRVEGSFSKALTLPSGEHVVQVRVTSASDHFDQSKQLGINLLPHGEGTIAVSTHSNAIAVVYQGPPVAPVQESSSGYSGTIRSIAVTILGSAVSALIGFMVQEFLKSKKEARRVEREKTTTAAG